MTLLEKRRRALMTGILLLAIAGTFVVASIVSSRVFERSTSSAESEPRYRAAQESSGAANPDAGLFRVAAIEGPVETFHRRQWYVVQAGDTLSPEDVIRTPRGSRALLRRGGTDIEVKENVDIRLDRLAERTATFGLLRGGNVTANVAAQDENLEITARESRTSNRGTARWVVSLGPEGKVNVAASKGEVRFSSHGKEVRVSEGMESSAAEGHAPNDPERIPEDLFMSIVWPELQREEARAPIRGKVGASSRVRVNGVEAPVAGDGSFTVTHPLVVGANRVEVEAEDISGRKKSVSRTIHMDPRKPTLKAAQEALWKR